MRIVLLKTPYGEMERTFSEVPRTMDRIEMTLEEGAKLGITISTGFAIVESVRWMSNGSVVIWIGDPHA